jgi:hypothetical protein
MTTNKNVSAGFISFAGLAISVVLLLSNWDILFRIGLI